MIIIVIIFIIIIIISLCLIVFVSYVQHRRVKIPRNSPLLVLFDFGVIPQVLSTERTVIVNNRLRRWHCFQQLTLTTPAV